MSAGRDQASAQASEAPVNRAMPAVNTRCCPTISPSAATGSSVATTAS